ncbi:hypothetical protein GQ600_10682 [Phytophthora cactorum]|nr:hypothetical protein GQ600_10682 [Phytophthora cactorum]
MESKTLLKHAVAAAAGVGGGLSGAKLPSSAASKPEYDPPKPQPTNTNTKHSLTSPIASWTPRIMQRNSIHQSSSRRTDGTGSSGTFHEAKVGAGQNLRSDRATPTESVSPVILHLRRQVETLVYGLKKVSPELDLRNVVSTQFAIFPGDGARFVKHVDTYSNAHSDERGGMSKDGLVRLVTCVYYLNDQWEPEHDDDDDTRAYLESKYSTSKVRVHWVDFRKARAAGVCGTCTSAEVVAG